MQSAVGLLCHPTFCHRNILNCFDDIVNVCGRLSLAQGKLHCMHWNHKFVGATHRAMLSFFLLRHQSNPIQCKKQFCSLSNSWYCARLLVYSGFIIYRHWKKKGSKKKTESSVARSILFTFLVKCIKTNKSRNKLIPFRAIRLCGGSAAILKYWIL